VNYGTDYSSTKAKNLGRIYKYFYNYLPTFFGHGFKGVALIYELGKLDTKSSFKLGVEYGFFLQFGVFSYIMTAIQNRHKKD